MVFQAEPVQKIKFFENYYTLGFDESKVKKGVADYTKLKDYLNDPKYGDRIVASDVIHYEEVGGYEGVRQSLEQNNFAKEVL